MQMFAKDFTASLIAGKIVEVRTKKTDRYGRQIEMVFINDVNVNEALLKNGLAWHFKKYDKTAAWTFGQWLMPVSPWEWRGTIRHPGRR